MNNVKSIIIYGKDNCPHCVRAVGLASQKGLSYQYLSLGKDYTKEQLVQICSLYGRVPKTVPQIFSVAESNVATYIGGADDFEKLVREGE